MHRSAALALLSVLLVWSQSAIAADQVTLFDARGKAVAYMAPDDDLTVYLWSGKPVAYLYQDSGSDFHVYGFNGKHLGWFVNGVVRDHDGNAACAIKEVMRSTEFEPFKAFKQFKPFKSFKEFAPFRPFLSTIWGDIPCRFLLADGAS